MCLWVLVDGKCQTQTLNAPNSKKKEENFKLNKYIKASNSQEGQVLQRFKTEE